MRKLSIWFPANILKKIRKNLEISTYKNAVKRAHLRYDKQKFSLINWATGHRYPESSLFLKSLITMSIKWTLDPMFNITSVNLDKRDRSVDMLEGRRKEKLYYEESNGKKLKDKDKYDGEAKG